MLLSLRDGRLVPALRLQGNSEKRKTNPLWKKTIARSKPSAIAQCDSACRCLGSIVDYLVLALNQFISSGFPPIKLLTLCTSTLRSIRSCENKLQSFKNSFIVDLFAIYFLTRSKKASSSDVAADVEVGRRGSGITGVSVGETAGASAVIGL